MFILVYTLNFVYALFVYLVYTSRISMAAFVLRNNTQQTYPLENCGTGVSNYRYVGYLSAVISTLHTA